MSTTASDFYVIGGTLRRDALSYVERRADDDLYDGLKAGQFCYVLTSRQMGKSSLMVRTAVRLRADNVTVSVLDLTAIGQNVTAEQWYEGLLGLIGQQLDLEDELEDFWLRHKQFGPLQRWMRAVKEVVLTRRRESIVIFVDEIDAVRSLPFSTDEFFAGIREFYNRRTEDGEMARLTFCLLGVATPSDLIRDTRTTPFNIGRRIELTDFAESEAIPLAQGLGRDERTSGALLKRILYWTGGHPYLTQRLCQAVAKETNVVNASGVDRVCEQLFLSSRARERDDNLLFVRERLLRSEEADRASLLDLYLKARNNKRVPDDETNMLISVLRLSGITRAVDGNLYVRNRIYCRVFDKAWVIANMPDAEVRRQQAAYRKGLVRAACIAAIIILIMGGLAIAAIRERNRATHTAEELQQTQEKLQAALVEAQQQRDLATAKSLEAEGKRREAEEQRTVAQEKTRQAEEQKKVAEAANKKLKEAEASTKKALEDAIRGREIAQKAEQVAIDERKIADKLSLIYRRDNLEGSYRRLKMAQQLEQISPAEERDHWKIQQGDAWASLGNSDIAISLYKSVLETDPDNFAALSARGSQYLLGKEPEKALPDIMRALAINDKLPYLYLSKALGQSYLGKYDDAIETMGKGIKIFSHLGYAEYKERDVTEEIEKVTRQKAIYADSEAMLTVFYYDIANLAASSGSKDFAAMLEAANARPNSTVAQLYALNLSLLKYKKRANDYGALVAQGALWERAGYCDKANETYKAFRKEHEKRRDPRYEGLAKWLANTPREKLQTSIARCRSFPQNNKTAYDYMLEWNEYAWSGDFDKAETILTTAVDEARDNPDPLIERMKFRYFNKGNFAGAKEDAEVLIKMKKGTALAFLLRAMSKAQLNTSDTTIIDDVSKAKQLNPSILPLINDLGGSGINGKMLVEVVAKTNRAEAIDLLERYIRYIEPSSYPHYLLAKFLNDKRDFEKARAQINIAIAMDRTRFEYFDEKLRAEAGLVGNASDPKQANQNSITTQRNKFIYYSDAGDVLSKRAQVGTALYAYGEGLKALNEIAGQTKNVEDVQCEVAATTEKIFNLLRAQGPKDDAVQYIAALSGLNNISALIQRELNKLSVAP